MHTIEPGGQPAAPAEPLPWAYAQQMATPVVEPRASRADLARCAVVTLALFAVLGCLAGWLWSVWADPPQFVVTRNGAVMGAIEAGRSFGPDVVFSAITVVAGLTLGSLLGWRYGRVGWLLPVLAAVAAGIAAIIAWRLGIALGPPDPATALQDASTGDLMPERLDVHARGLLLLWPVAALVGVIASISAHSGQMASRSGHSL